MKVFIFFILLVPFVCALEVSPAQLDFVGGTGDILCGDVVVDIEASNVVVENRWANIGYTGRDFLAHKLASADLGLDVNFENEFFADGKVKKEICISGNRAGVYHGLLLFRASDRNVGVGIWLNVSLGGLDVVELPSDNDSDKLDGNFILSLLVLLVVFLVILFAVLISW